MIYSKKYGFRDWDSVLAAVGHGGLKEGQVVNRLAEEYGKEHKQELTNEAVLEKVAEDSVHSHPGRGEKESCPGARDVAMCSSRGRQGSGGLRPTGSTS